MLGNLIEYSIGYLSKAAKKDDIRAWSITRTGMDYVENKLAGGAENPTQ